MQCCWRTSDGISAVQLGSAVHFARAARVSNGAGSHAGVKYGAGVPLACGSACGLRDVRCRLGKQ
eukprot:7385860-Prymnesium_polylepis.2